MEQSTKAGIFEEDNGNKSSMRVMCFISLIAAIFFGILALLFADAAVVSSGVFITTAFLVGAFAPKALQKFAEKKIL